MNLSNETSASSDHALVYSPHRLQLSGCSSFAGGMFEQVFPFQTIGENCVSQLAVDQLEFAIESIKIAE